MFTLQRSERNPILAPLKTNSWESRATFNGCPVKIDKNTTALLYRAMSEADPFKPPHVPISCIGVAFSKNDEPFTERRKLIEPSEDFDKWGCEDPRVTKVGDTYYIFYTALSDYPYGPHCIKTAVALSKDLKTIDKKFLVTPFNSKAMALFPEKIGDEYMAFITIDTDPGPSKLCIRTFKDLSELSDQKKWQKWYEQKEKHEVKLRREERDHVELGAPPLKTDKGWVLFYSHIQNYWTDKPLFGIEALLLDIKNPKKIIGRTNGPFITPEWYYEKIGQVSNITFPSGALVEGDHIDVYYGAADTFCAKASISKNAFLSALEKPIKPERFKKNPILSPREGFEWEKGGVLNPGVIEIDGTIHILYRAATTDNHSTFGYAQSQDGFTITYRSDTPIYSPRTDFESYGVEDPRLVLIKDTIYMTYTGYNGTRARIVVSSISKKDFIKQKWDAWTYPCAITPDTLDDKDASILPEKNEHGYLVFHRAGNDICGDYFSTLEPGHEKITKCIDIAAPRPGMWDHIKIGLSVPPIKTKKGWVLIYHGISEHKIYRVGALLLDLKDPTHVLARTAAPFFEPEMEYEKNGIVSNVVFPCGAVLRGDTVFMYYGAGDTHTAVATISLQTILSYLGV